MNNTILVMYKVPTESEKFYERFKHGEIKKVGESLIVIEGVEVEEKPFEPLIGVIHLTNDNFLLVKRETLDSPWRLI